MEYAPLESRDGVYDIYYIESGERLVVLEGLSVEDVQQDHEIQSFIHAHYDTISLMYWVLYAVTLTFLVTRFLAVPLITKWRGGRSHKVRNSM